MKLTSYHHNSLERSTSVKSNVNWSRSLVRSRQTEFFISKLDGRTHTTHSRHALPAITYDCNVCCYCCCCLLALFDSARRVWLLPYTRSHSPGLLLTSSLLTRIPAVRLKLLFQVFVLPASKVCVADCCTISEHACVRMRPVPWFGSFVMLFKH